jgi:hypothetical protein
LELIVRLPAMLLGRDSFTPVLQDYCSLPCRKAFASLSWNDTRQIAAAVGFDVTQHEDAPDVMGDRARDVLAGIDGMTWQKPEGAERALNIAATVFDQLRPAPGTA